MKFKLVVREEAEKDIQSAYDWYEGSRIGLGEEFLLCLDAVIESIARQPDLYAVVHRTARRTLTRRFPYGVFFTIEQDVIVVLAVMHCRRNPDVWKRRKATK